MLIVMICSDFKSPKKKKKHYLQGIAEHISGKDYAQYVTTKIGMGLAKHSKLLYIIGKT